MSQDALVYDNIVTYMFIQHCNVYLVITAGTNCNAASSCKRSYDSNDT